MHVSGNNTTQTQAQTTQSRIQGLMYHHEVLRSSLRIELSWFKPWLGTLCIALAQNTLFSECLSPPKCIFLFLKLSGGLNTNFKYSTTDEPIL